MNTLHKKAEALVAGDSRVQDWSVYTTHRSSHELYLVRAEEENRRAVETLEAEVTIHRDLRDAEGEARRGFSSFVLLADDDDAAARAKLEQALFAAELALNPPYALPGPAGYPEVSIWDAEIAEAPDEVLSDLAAQYLGQLEREPLVGPSSAEFFTHRAEVHLSNSRGIEAHTQGTQLFVEMVILSSNGHEESEYFATLRRRARHALDLAAEVSRFAERARDSLRADTPPTYKGPVAVSGQALVDLLAFLEYASSGAMKYQNMSRWEIGQSIYGEKAVQGDPLTLVADATIPWGVGSVPFDEDGVAGQQATLVENGILERFWAGYRYAQYLGIPATGNFSNMSIPAGSMAASDLLTPEGRLFHVVSFAAMDPDPITGQFVGEVRLGYQIGPDGTHPFKGGALSGDMESALANVRFSRDTIFLGQYHGPEVARFGELRIGGD